MDPFGTSSIVDGALAMQQSQVTSQLSLLTLRKVLDTQSQMALALIQAVAAPQTNVSPPSPEGTGETIDIKA